MRKTKIQRDTGGGCSICGGLPAVNVDGSYWLCGPCVKERHPLYFCRKAFELTGTKFHFTTEQLAPGGHCPDCGSFCEIDEEMKK